MPDNLYLWSPHNVQRVRASGIESDADFSADFGMIRTWVHASYAFTKSIDQTQGGSVYGEQLPYVPLHKGIIGANVTFKKASLGYSQVFTGARATSAEHTEILPSFSTGRLVMGYEFIAQHFTIDFQFKIDNIWDIEYQVIQYYRNPGRAFSVGLNVKIK